MSCGCCEDVISSRSVTRYRTGEPRPVFPGDGVMKLAGTIEAGVERSGEFPVRGAPQGVVVLDIPTLLEIGAIGRVMELIDGTGARSLRLIRRDGR